MPLIGIAALAHSAPTLLSKRAVSYLQLPTRNWINRCAQPTRVPFDWTINPYRGCEFGCKYCYARYTHEFLELRDPELFETRIFAKQFHAPAFRQELRAIRREDHIAIGTATDPYQPAEGRYQLTRRILTIFSQERGRKLSMISKSHLVARDADLLSRIARRSLLHVSLTVTTMDAALARLLEPRAPRPDLRIRAVRDLTGRGVPAGVFVAPVLPGINDSEASLRAVAQAAADAGARSFGANVLFLKPCAQQVFQPFLETHYPQLAAAYQREYGKGAYLRGDYPRRIQERVERIREQLRLGRRGFDYVPEEYLGEEQLSLFGEASAAG